MQVKQVIETILTLNGNRKIEPTCDLLIEGSWDYHVTGIVTTFMATVDVIRRAAKMGCNLIITHEPTYFTGADHLEWLKEDPVYHHKKALIDENKITIWRFHDHMHMGNEDLIYAGLLQTLGWQEYLDKKLPQPHCYTIPETTVSALVDFFKKTLGMDVIQVVGNPEMKCRRVGILVGGGSLGLGKEEMPAKLMYDEQLEVIVCGEITEWTLSAYVRDAAAMGFDKALIIVGHERSEEPGMKALAERLQPLVGKIPVRFIDAEEPFIYL
jgi:putative NIF3 family GTP cyclohydrolase 1 type 2